MTEQHELATEGHAPAAEQPDRPHGERPATGADQFASAAIGRAPFANGAAALVITCSDRAAAGEYDDRSGVLVEQTLDAWGYRAAREVVPDGDPVAQAITLAVRRGQGLIITTGGTGLGPRDLTADVTAPLLDRTLPGIPEAIRAVGVARGVPTSVLSRGVAGCIGSTVVVNLPGSVGAVRDGLDVLADVLPHLAEQLGDAAAAAPASEARPPGVPGDPF